MALSVTSNTLSFLRLIRWPNLVITGFCLLVFHIKLLHSAHRFHIHLTLSGAAYIFFVISMLCVMAAGYVINDLEDQKTDACNKPEKQWIPHPFSQLVAVKFIWILTAIGAMTTVVTAIIVGNWKWSLLYPVFWISLYFYTKKLKGSGFIGNLFIALLSALVPLTLLLPEGQLIQRLRAANELYLIYLFLGFAVFAFFTSFFRELVKDLEDEPGDRLAGIKTFAVHRGIHKAKKLAIAAGLFNCLVTGMASVLIFTEISSKILLFVIAIAQAGLVLKTKTASTSSDFKTISTISKGILACGLLTAWLAL